MKKLLTLFLALVAGVGTLFAESGECGEHLTWDLTDGVLTISGTGLMTDFDWEKSPWYSYRADIKSLIIASGVTSIGTNAFYNCSELTSVTIPNSVTSIGEYAFYGCDSLPVENNIRYADTYLVGAVDKTLSTCTIREGTRWIGSSAFQHCTSLTSIEIPNSVTSIGEYAFSYCSGLTSIEIPNSVTSIGKYAFSGCTGLKGINVATDNPNYCSVDGVLFNKDMTMLIQYPGGKSGAYSIPNSVTSIGNCAFYYCTGLTSVTIPNSVTSIEDWAFGYCSGLTSIEIPNSVTSIGSWAFGYILNVNYNGTATGSPWEAKSVNGFVDGWLVYSDNTKTNLLACSSAATGTIEIPTSVTSIGENAFRDCSGLKSIDIPNSVTNIGDGAFYGCGELKSIDIPNSVTSIGVGTFGKCSGLTSITIPNSVISIGDGAFNGCFSLDTIFIPKNVEIIGIGAFSAFTATDDPSQSRLKAIIVDKDNPYFTSLDGALYDKDIKTLLQCPIEKEGTFVIPSTVDSICIYSGCGSHISELIIPGSVRNIPPYTFAFCPELTTILMQEGVRKLDEASFYVNPKLEHVIFPNSLTTIESSAFLYSFNIREFTLGSNIEYIGSNAFTLDVAYLSNITCLAKKVPFCASNFISALQKTWEEDQLSISNVDLSLLNLHIYVPSTSVDAYKADNNWGKFTILPITAQSEDVAEVKVTPTTTTADIAWPTVSGAASYELVIKDKSGNVVCTLTFNADGLLTQLSFAAPARDRNKQTQTAGFQFTITGLEEGTTYDYTIVSKDANGQVLDTQSGSFKTKDSGNTTYYTITFVNWDGTELLKLTNVEEGTTPVYTGLTPTRPEDSDYTYSFSGWTPNIVVATSNATYTAVYEASPKSESNITYYIVKFVDWDDTILKKQTVEKGQNATAPEDPIRSGYTFKGWDKEFTNVQSDLVVKAVYEKNPDEAIDEINAENVVSRKVLHNGQIFILRNGEVFNAQGVRVD